MSFASDTLKRLKDEGYKVRVQHLRRAVLWEDCDVEETLYSKHEIRDFPEGQIVATGGETRVSIETADGFSGVNGVAQCSLKDNFCRKTGLEIALQRALILLGRDA